LQTGRSVALKFAKTYPVALLARNPANFESIVKEIKAAGGQAIGISTDVTSASSVQNAFAEIQKEFEGKKLAAAVYNAGGGFNRKPFLELTLKEYEAGYESNGYVSSLAPYSVFVGAIIRNSISIVVTIRSWDFGIQPPDCPSKLGHLSLSYKSSNIGTATVTLNLL
jgi:NAD(P)-dependent dehydrogenase (short-subunit alcohol dehydrogenase family)